MSARRPNVAPRRNWAEHASAAIRVGDLAAADRYFREAVRADRRNAQHRLHWASVLEDLAQYGAAAEQLTEALHLDPGMSAAAGRLSSLLGRHALPANAKFNPTGLRVALDHDNASTDLVSDLAVAHLMVSGSLRQAADSGARNGWLGTARDLCLRKTTGPLKDPLFLAVLRRNVLRNPDLERLLAALRRVLLLEVRPQRFEDPALTRFAVAMMLQCHANEHVWPVSPEEAVALGAAFEPRGLLAGDPADAARFLVVSTYRRFTDTLGHAVSPADVEGIRPREVRDALHGLVAEHADLRARAARIPVLGGIADATSQKVAQQYEHNPYPRWSSVHVPPESEMRKRFGEFFKPAQLAFMDQPFETLVAGCGTGRQVVVSALSMPNARVTAIDLSASSLAYAARMAERLGAGNITFARADILDIPTVAPQFQARFQVIACTGVLHHMADPFAGWRRLVDCLAPGGLMLTGLYSAVARRNLAALRGDPAFPGPGCHDEALRAFRQLLMDRPPGRLGSELQQSTDFYTTSEFRDLVCHVSERHLTIPEIRTFLDANGLAFRGFWLDPHWLRLFRQQFPEESWPGRLDCWQAFELANPGAFGSMYHLWCIKA